MAREAMVLPLLLCLSASFFLSLTSGEAQHNKTALPQELPAFDIGEAKLVRRSCSYTVKITTSCSSTRNTRDRISLTFGDAYGNRVHVRRLDDPSKNIFGPCTTHTFKMQGPCGHGVCYAYVVRTGGDGWVPQRIKIKEGWSRSITFDYDYALPPGVWCGANMCGRLASSSTGHTIRTGCWRSDVLLDQLERSGGGYN